MGCLPWGVEGVKYVARTHYTSLCTGTLSVGGQRRSELQDAWLGRLLIMDVFLCSAEVLPC
jgi:hypothetical protein